MGPPTAKVQSAVRLLQQQQDEEKKRQGVLVLRELAMDVRNKEYICSSGGMELLLDLMEGPASEKSLVAATEVIALLVTENDDARSLFRELGGIQVIIQLLQTSLGGTVFHRALLVLRILTDKEIDRYMIWKASGLSILVDLLRNIDGVDTEIIEFAAAALGNMAAGSNEIKDALREAGAMRPLIRLLQGPHSAAAELAAVALRNMSLGHRTNRELLMSLNGLNPLLELLSLGQERLEFPLHCKVIFAEDKGANKGPSHCEGMCNFNPVTGHLNVALHEDNNVRSMEPNKLDLRDKNVLVFSLLHRLTITEPENQTLEISFMSKMTEGAKCLSARRISNRHRLKYLQTIFIHPCSASEVKASLMRMLTKLHLQSEFEMVSKPAPQQHSGQTSHQRKQKKIIAASTPVYSMPGTDTTARWRPQAIAGYL